MEIRIREDINRQLNIAVLNNILTDLELDLSNKFGLPASLLNLHISKLKSFRDYLISIGETFHTNKADVNLIIDYLLEYKISLENQHLTYITTQDALNLYISAIEDIINQLDNQVVDQITITA